MFTPISTEDGARKIPRKLSISDHVPPTSSNDNFEHSLSRYLQEREHWYKMRQVPKLRCMRTFDFNPYHSELRVEQSNHDLLRVGFLKCNFSNDNYSKDGLRVSHFEQNSDPCKIPCLGSIKKEEDEVDRKMTKIMFPTQPDRGDTLVSADSKSSIVSRGASTSKDEGCPKMVTKTDERSKNDGVFLGDTGPSAMFYEASPGDEEIACTVNGLLNLPGSNEKR